MFRIVAKTMRFMDAKFLILFLWLINLIKRDNNNQHWREGLGGVLHMKMTSASPRCPASGSRCGYTGIFLVYFIKINPLEQVLVDWACWSDWAVSTWFQIHPTSHMARLNKDLLYVHQPSWLHTVSLLALVQEKIDISAKILYVYSICKYQMPSRW